MKSFIYGMLFVLLFFLGLATSFLFGDPPQKFDFQHEKRRLALTFLLTGESGAQQLMDKLAKAFDPGRLHDLEHVYGMMLYKRAGLKGVGWCGDTSQFGCYHGFFGAALSREGSSLLQKVADICQISGDRYQIGGCYHGLGHGLLAHQGYTEAQLMSSLNECDQLSAEEGKKGCYSGVFMEYNTQTMTEDSPKSRKWDNAKPFDPCSYLDARYQSSCYFEQPTYWQREVPNAFVTMGSWCLTAPQGFQDECFSGIGQVIVGVAKFDRSVAVSFCQTLAEAGASDCIAKVDEQLSLVKKDTMVNDTLIKRDKAKLSRAFARLGSQGGYTYFTRIFARSLQAHELAHWVGEELYRREGRGGLSFCDSAFVYGCYHGFFIIAFSKEGASILQDAEAICTADGKDQVKTAGCLHGVGHGALAVFARYDEEHLKKALTSCDILSSEIAKRGCYNGVFMEYNERPLHVDVSKDDRLRKLDLADPLGPCNRLAPRYQSDCYYEQVSWWFQIFGSNAANQVTGYCRLIDEESNRIICARSLGRSLVTTQNSDIKIHCQKFSEFATECIGGALQQLISEKQDHLGVFCKGVADILSVTTCENIIKKTQCELFQQCDS